MSKEKPDAWMPFYIGDYKADTGRLRCEHHGAYLLLIMDYWRNGPPPDDDAQLASITCNDPKSWRRIRPMVAPFFQIRDGHWFQKRIEAELERWAGKREKAIEKARIAAERRWKKDAPSNASSMPQALLEECPSASASPVVGRASKKALPLNRARAPTNDPNGSSPSRPKRTLEETKALLAAEPGAMSANVVPLRSAEA